MNRLLQQDPAAVAASASRADLVDARLLEVERHFAQQTVGILGGVVGRQFHQFDSSFQAAYLARAAVRSPPADRWFPGSATRWPPSAESN